MKRYYAFDDCGKKEFKVEDGMVSVLCDNGEWGDVTLFVLAATDFEDAEEALIDLYTDQGDENVRIVEVQA